MQFFDPRQAALKHSETIEELSDPLLALAGTLTCGATNIGEKHDEYIGQALLKEMRGADNGASWIARVLSGCNGAD